MRILIVAERLPSPLGGGSSRQYNLIRSLSNKHRFTVIANAFPEDLNYLDQLTSFVERVEFVSIDEPVEEKHSKFYWQINAWQHTFFDLKPYRGRFFQTLQMQQLISKTLMEDGPFDLIQVHQSYMMPQIPKINYGGTNGYPAPRILLDMHDILSDFERAQIETRSKPSHRFQAWLEWKKSVAQDRAAVGRASICTVTSKIDRQRLQILAPGMQAVLVPNGVDIEYFTCPIDGANSDSIIFTGSMNYPPNADAVRWFSNEIFPLVQNQIPDVHWKVVGWSPPADILALDRPPLIEITGYVPDIRPYLASAGIVIAPVLSGGGTRLKILEAWAMGKPVVSTTLGAEGLHAVHAENILLADDAPQFATYAIELIKNQTERCRLGLAGRQTVEQYYSWTAISREMQRAYEMALFS